MTALPLHSVSISSPAQIAAACLRRATSRPPRGHTHHHREWNPSSNLAAPHSSSPPKRRCLTHHATEIISSMNHNTRPRCARRSPGPGPWPCLLRLSCMCSATSRSCRRGHPGTARRAVRRAGRSSSRPTRTSTAETRFCSGGPAFGLVAEVEGDRGLGPVIEAHPELVNEVAATAPTPTSTRPRPGRGVEASWAARVRANREQVDRIREVPDGTDFYAPVTSLFRADPTRTDDPVLDGCSSSSGPGDTWLDVGAGAGRFALPLARALDASGGSVVALDASPRCSRACARSPRTTPSRTSGRRGALAAGRRRAARRSRRTSR